jgi:uncharacterized protein
MKWDWPMRPIKSGPLTNWEIEELDVFLLADDGLENAMDVSTFDGFLCAALSGPNVIMPSEWMRWVWDKEEGAQAPEFASEKQAQRILSLLIRHANVIAFTLTQAPQYYEPLFLERKVKGRIVSIVDEWCCGYVKGIALDPLGWQPLIEARPDWFEVIRLYGTKSGWDRLKELVDAHEDAIARHQAFVDLIAPAARNIHAHWLARRAPGEEAIRDPRQPIHKMPFLAAMTFAHVAPARSSSAAMGRRRKRRTELLHRGSLDNCHLCGRFNFLTIRPSAPC